MFNFEQGCTLWTRAIFPEFGSEIPVSCPNNSPIGTAAPDSTILAEFLANSSSVLPGKKR